jgi:hypothetical protein
MTDAPLHIWALDLDSKNRPFQAHLITAIAKGRYGEIRYSACGRDYTAHTHPRGWWTSHAGRFGMLERDTHCGREIVAEWAER